MNNGSRRIFMMQVAVAGAAALVGASARAAEVHLSETDAEATAVAYALDATKVNKARFPKKGATDHCGNCKAFIAKPGDAWGNCALIDEKMVSTAGWCSSFVLKS
jgi:High potential iron-sulfur protein